jgi:flagellar motor switch/type III secretory pathway protein FliN
MRHLRFGASGVSVGGRRVRPAVFEERSLLPVSAACVVANAMRETLGSLFAAPVEVRLFEPLIPSADAWHAIADRAHVFGIRGSLADAAIVLRPGDAVSLVGAAFGETLCAARPLSPIERTVLERTVRAMTAACVPVCGSCGEPAALSELRGFATFFEVAVERPVPARIGIALSREPQPKRGDAVSRSALDDVPLELAVRLEGATIPAHALELEVGAVIPLGRGPELAGRLAVAGRTLARGECGVKGVRYAITLSEIYAGEGSSEHIS